MFCTTVNLNPTDEQDALHGDVDQIMKNIQKLFSKQASLP